MLHRGTKRTYDELNQLDTQKYKEKDIALAMKLFCMNIQNQEYDDVLVSFKILLIKTIIIS